MPAHCMKFTALFLVFNIVILGSFLTIFLVPVAFLGVAFLGEFVSRNWYAGLLFLLVLGAVNFYFIVNWRLFRMLEREDFAGVATELESRIFTARRVRRLYVQLLVNAYLMLRRPVDIRNVERAVRAYRPELLGRVAFQLAVPYIVAPSALDTARPPRLDAEANGRDAGPRDSATDSMMGIVLPADPRGYFADVLAREKVVEEPWVRIGQAFVFVRDRELPDARSALEPVVAETTDVIPRMTGLYLLASTGGEAAIAAQAAAEAMRANTTVARIGRDLESRRYEIPFVVFGRMIDDAREWLAGPAED